MRAIIAVLAAFLFFAPAWGADDAQSRSLPDGLALNIGGNEVELRVATPRAFRLHVSTSAGLTPKPSIFLSGDELPATAFSVTQTGSIMGIKTTFGDLRVDVSNQKWSLRNGQGALLTDWAPLPAISAANTPNNEASFRLEVGPPLNKEHHLYYGSGNVPNLGALTQTESRSHAGNGSTSLPQYWSNAGYGALLVTAVDNKPALWKLNSNGGVDWTVSGPSADLYLAPAANLYDWLRDDAELTGFAPVPPLWSFGYLQSRWGWTDKAYIDETLAHFRKDNLPVDGFILDFEWYTKTPDYDVKAPGDPSFIDFSWNPTLFPDPKKQISDFAEAGLHIVGIRKPRIGNSENLDMARSKGWVLPVNPEDPNNDNIRTRNLDFSNPDVQVWWQENNRKFLEAGMAGFWNDEGETTFTEYSYWNLTEVALLKQVDPDARFWSLNRSFGPGLQRFGAAVWTGDIPADWETLAKTPGELMSYGLSGMPYSTCDIGGFSGNPSPELLARWMEAGVFFPIQRSHSELHATPRFPWLYGPQAEDAIRKALDFRYRLIPYYYSLAFENNTTAAPLMRPLAMEFPSDEKVWRMTDEWLMGKGLLVAPILQQGGARDVYLPEDDWYSFGTNQMLRGPQTLHVVSELDEIPVYVRAGTLLPLGPVRQYTGQISDAPLELQIYPGRDGASNFVEDDGKTLGYQKGLTRVTAFTWNDQTKILSWKIRGNYTGTNCYHEIKAVLMSLHGLTEKKAPMDPSGTINFK